MAEGTMQPPSGGVSTGLACTACHDAKRYCDKKTPCGRCVLHKLQCMPHVRGPGRPVKKKRGGGSTAQASKKRHAGGGKACSKPSSSSSPSAAHAPRATLPGSSEVELDGTSVAAGPPPTEAHVGGDESVEAYLRLQRELHQQLLPQPPQQPRQQQPQGQQGLIGGVAIVPFSSHATAQARKRGDVETVEDYLRGLQHRRHPHSPEDDHPPQQQQQHPQPLQPHPHDSHQQQHQQTTVPQAVEVVQVARNVITDVLLRVTDAMVDLLVSRGTLGLIDRDKITAVKRVIDNWNVMTGGRDSIANFRPALEWAAGVAKPSVSSRSGVVEGVMRKGSALDLREQQAVEDMLKEDGFYLQIIYRGPGNAEIATSRMMSRHFISAEEIMGFFQQTGLAHVYSWSAFLDPDSIAHFYRFFGTFEFERGVTDRLDTVVQCRTRDGRVVRCVASLGRRRPSPGQPAMLVLRLWPFAPATAARTLTTSTTTTPIHPPTHAHAHTHVHTDGGAVQQLQQLPAVNAVPITTATNNSPMTHTVNEGPCDTGVMGVAHAPLPSTPPAGGSMMAVD